MLAERGVTERWPGFDDQILFELASSGAYRRRRTPATTSPVTRSGTPTLLILARQVTFTHDEGEQGR